MKVFVYGTLKRNYGNNRLLAGCDFEGEQIIPGYKLYYSYEYYGFPVAHPSENSFIKGEIYNIPDDIAAGIIRNLDFLESNGSMYNRTMINEDTFLYVGHPDNWAWKILTECPSENNIYSWERVL